MTEAPVESIATARRGRAVLCAIGALVALTAAQLLRQPGAPTWDTIWAEDGRIYATDAVASDWATSIGRGYAGYVQALPRLLALPLRLLPPAWWAWWLAASAALVTSLLALFVYRMSAAVLETRALRVVVALMTAVGPAMWFEANANLANLGWPLLIATLWALIGTTRRWWDAVTRGAVLVGTALSTTVAVLYVPLAFVVAWRRREDRGELWLAGVFVAAVVVQFVAVQFTEQRPEPISVARHLPTIVAVRVFGSLLVGERWLDNAWLRHRGVAAAAFVAAVVVTGVVATRLVHRSNLALPAAIAALGLGSFVVPVWIRGTEEMHLAAGSYSPAGSRYVVVPIALLVAALAVAVQRSRRPWLVWALAAHTVVVVVAALGMTNIRSHGPRWSTGLDRAKAACEEQQGDATVWVAHHATRRALAGRGAVRAARLSSGVRPAGRQQRVPARNEGA